jgi:PAS domain S-box-containing protein
MENFDASLPAKFKFLRDGVVITNAAGEILWFNAGFETMCGYTLDESKGKKPGSFLQGPKSNPELIQNMRDAIKAGRPCSVEITNYHKDGHEYMVHITFTPVRRKDGVIQYFAAIEREFQEEEIDRLGRENIERALQEELAELVKELQRDID